MDDALEKKKQRLEALRKRKEELERRKKTNLEKPKDSLQQKKKVETLMTILTMTTKITPQIRKTTMARILR